MRPFATSLLIIILTLLPLLADAAHSPTFGKESNREQQRQLIFIYPSVDVDPKEYLYLSPYSPDFQRSSSVSSSSQARQRLFYNLLASLFSNFGSINTQQQSQQGQISQSQTTVTCPTCPVATCPVCLTCPVCAGCPAPSVCPTVTRPAVLSLSSRSPCVDEASSSSCSTTSIASSGTFRVTWDTWRSGGSPPTSIAILNVIPQAPNTKVSVVCPFIPAGVTISSESGGRLTANLAQVINGAAKITYSATASTTNDIDAVCAWASHNI